MIYSKNEFKERLFDLCEKGDLSDIGIPAAEKLYIICEQLDLRSKQFNLTAITEPEEVLKKHIMDCLFTAKCIDGLTGDGMRLLDVGSGAGFPSLPIAASVEKISVTAMDSTAKKTVYMNETAALAGIDNFKAVPARAEEAARTDMRASFDVCTARAVARLNVLMELCAPFLKMGGYFVSMKGAAADEEMKEAESAAKKLGLTFVESRRYFIPEMDDARFLLIYRKDSKTPELYPRNFSQISKKPL